MLACPRGRTLLWLAIAFVLELGLITGGAEAECPDTRCGGMDIPYPFSIFGQDSCAAMPHFEQLHCNNSRPFLGPFEVLNISLQLGQLRVLNRISSFCYNTSHVMEHHQWRHNLSTSFRLSDTGNKFTVIGCRTLAYITDRDFKYMSGCVSACQREGVTGATNGSCSGIGCCQTTIPKGLDGYRVFFSKGLNTSDLIYHATPCSYAVLVDSSDFKFSTSYLTSLEFNTTYDGRAPMLLDWAIRTAHNCDEAQKNLTLYACKSDNSECINSSNGQGYICNCTEGYQGNPYRQNGCQDIDECKEPNKCYGKCRNKNGGFDCTCPFGTRGNAHTGPCDRGLAIGICASLLVTLTILLGIEWFRYKQRIIRKDLMRQREELMRQREEYFHQHGGQLLRNMMSRDNNIPFMLYDRDQIESATNGFDNMLVIGQGGQGTVYRGCINPDNPVAIKKCKGFDEDSWAEFTDELLILSRVNHENIVKLLGCCLQFDVPILVYEFVQNKTLYNLIHIQNDPSIRTLEIRLKVAAESAEALAYLHSSVDHPIILHGDVKSTNILLNKNFIAKVSDFGCSKIRTADENYDVVKGTMGYLDPEYLRNFQLTDKSDVYSFGVVLLELLTRRMPLSVDKVSLALIFQEAMREGHFLELIDVEILHEDNLGLISDLATLASRCLIMTSESRPTMSMVADELRRRMVGQVQQDQGVLTGISSSLALTASSGANTSEYLTGERSTDYYDLERVASMNIEFAR
ncbi:wall-associated receptor kinase 2-like [Oryza glaberrima]|uniref:wall-associated receptor kinase 2-like n=1 Tax=Oryza glaberrima TaxID=4538 RepID=UPI00224BFBD6|nr:wall-associated receptor kinase 2-like [Oryza glaberrima]